ncbi:TPA: hypothetical protein ACH3X1_014756 [Trebouxia sp. C0004]
MVDQDLRIRRYGLLVQQLGHSWQQWTDSTVALANIKQVLDGLGLASVAWQSQEAAIAHAVAVNEKSEPHADAAALDTDSIANLGSELLQELKTPLQLPFLAESGDFLVTLRAAAIVKEHWIHMFNLDESPATCDIMSPFACSYKAFVFYGWPAASSSRRCSLVRACACKTSCSKCASYVCFVLYCSYLPTCAFLHN